MAIRTKRYTNGIILKPSILDSIPSSDAVNGLVVYDSQNHKLIVKIANANREIVTADQNQVLTNKTINTNQNTIQVSASGVSATELDAALEEIKGLIDDTSGAEVEIFNSTITVGTTAPSVTGVLHHKLSDDVDLKKATLQLFGKNDKYTGNMQIDVKKNVTPDDTGMVSVFSPTGKPTLNFQVADSDLVFNSAVDNKFPAVSLIQKILVQTIGLEKKYLVIGLFNYEADTSKANLIRLNSDGSEDTQFTINAVKTGASPNFNNIINDIVIDIDGNILVSGSFSNYKNSGINCLIKLSADGTFDPNDIFNQNMVGKFTIDTPSNILENCQQVKIQNNNIFYNKTKYISVGLYRATIVKINSSGVLDGSFLPFEFSGAIYAMEFTSQYIYVGGTFTNYGGSPNLNYAARLNIADGSIDGNFTAATQNKFNALVASINFQPDNKILFSGAFTNYGTTTGLNYIVRLNSDLSIDTVFRDNILNKFTVSSGKSISSSLDTSNKILLYGNFTHTTVVANLIRLNSDGSEDKPFNYLTSSINIVGNPATKLAFEGNYIMYSISSGILFNLKRITNYPERYNEYAVSSSSKDEGKIPTFELNEGEFVRLDISSIPPNYVGTIQVVLTGVKRI